jgi:hypothetical protein
MDKYIIDTSALISAKNYYPPKNFEPFWKFLIDLNKKDKLIVIDKVKEEIQNGYDFLKTDFAPKITASNSEIPEVINLFPFIMKSLSSSQKIGFSQWLKCPDPYVIAYGEYLKRDGNEIIILHGEKESGLKIRIPFVCNIIGLNQALVHRLIEEENLSFRFS